MKRNYMTYSELPEETKMLYEMVRDFADNDLAPEASKWDKNHEFPHEAIHSLVCLLYNFITMYSFFHICLKFT